MSLSRTVAAACLSLFLVAPAAEALTLTQNHRLYDKGPEVTLIQQFLNAQGYLVATEGYGSPGQETDFFGALTFAALKKFQAATGLPSTGFFGPMTRGVAATYAAATPSMPPSVATTPVVPGTYVETDQGTVRVRSAGGGSSGDSTPPAAPTNFSIVAGNLQTELAWTDPADSDLAQISIYRGTVSGTRTLLVTVSPGTQAYTDSSLSNGTTYYYALSATDADGNESSQTSQGSATPDTHLALASSLFEDTGRVAVWPDASNLGSGITGQVGSNRNAGEWGPLVGSPIFIMGREMSAHTWLGYEVATRGTTDDQYINHQSQAIYKPAKLARWDAGTSVADNGSGGSAAIPLDAGGTNTIRFRLNTLDTEVTDLALAVVYLSNSINKLAVVTVSGASSGTVAPNMLHTAAQAVADGWLASSALSSNGGSISDSAYVLSTNTTGRKRLNNSGFQSVPLASNLTPDDYTVTVVVTSVSTHSESSGTSRAYIGGLFYHSDNITEATSGAYMARMGYVSAAVDGSANETFYINGRPVASGSNREVGKAHGNETRTEEPELLVDGVAYRMSGNTATRARASNVVTVETSLPHGLTTGDVVTMSGFASTTYSAHEVAVTVADSTTFTYSDSGTNETEVADTTGRFIRKGIKLGSSSVQLSQASELFHQDYLSGNTPIGDLTTTYTLSDKIFATQAAGTIDIDFRHAGSFGILASYWSGDPSTKGPVYPGAATAKAHVPEQAETTLVSNDGSHALGGQSLTFALSRPESDLAHIAEISSFTGNASFSGSWDTFVEDRSDGNVEKLYLKLPDAGTVDVPAGWSFEYGSNRIDGLAPEAEDSGIFVD